jgi:hypothetical protein
MAIGLLCRLYLVSAIHGDCTLPNNDLQQNLIALPKWYLLPMEGSAKGHPREQIRCRLKSIFQINGID